MVHGEKIYISGDTFVFPQLVQELKTESPIKYAALPVNGHTFLKAEKNILGNMSTHEAFQLASECKFEYFLPTHWDMFDLNSVSLDEIRLLHERYYAEVNIIIGKRQLIFGHPKVSIVIRTLNEERYLAKVLTAVRAQKHLDGPVEVIIVDSGSTDNTIKIAESFHCKILRISRESFTFGRALNIGFEEARGEIIVALSGHCVPICDGWLEHLVHPIRSGQSVYTYGKQVGGGETNFAEARVFEQYYPEYSRTQTKDFYCNNANSALLKSTWERNKFDEKLTGLEDMALAKTLIGFGERISYVASSAVVHYHHETSKQVKRRFEREALALRYIDPHLNFSRKDLAVCFFRNCYYDIKKIIRRERLQFIKIPAIVIYRWHQFLGVYSGNHMSVEPSEERKKSYFYGDS
jgi:glycosyltransferase involved in cell wall biosynthesis